MFNVTKYKYYLYLSLKTFYKFINDSREKSILFIETPETTHSLHKHHVIMPCFKKKANSMSCDTVKFSFNGSSIYYGIPDVSNIGSLSELINVNLNDDLDEFGKVLWPNIEALFALFNQCYSIDETFRREVKTLFDSSEMYDLMDMIVNMPEFGEFMNFLEENGFQDVNDLEIDSIQDLVNTRIPSNVKDNLSESDNNNNKCPPTCGKPGLKGFVETAKKLVDIDAFRNLYNEKLETSEPFQKLVEYLRSEKFLAIVHAVKCDTNFQKIRKDAVEIGIDVQYIGEVLNKHLGW